MLYLSDLTEKRMCIIYIPDEFLLILLGVYAPCSSDDTDIAF